MKIVLKLLKPPHLMDISLVQASSYSSHMQNY